MLKQCYFNQLHVHKLKQAALFLTGLMVIVSFNVSASSSKTFKKHVEKANQQFCPKGSHRAKLRIQDVSLERVKNIPLNYQGFNNIEGPVWHDGALYYSNVGSAEPDEKGFALSNQTTLWRWEPGNKPQVWLTDDVIGSNGLAVDFDGNLLAARHKDGSVGRIDWDTKKITTLASAYEDKRFNAPNDLTVTYDGTIFFTDPNWDTPNNVDKTTIQGGGDPGSMAPGQRVYRITPEGIVTPTAATELVPELRDKPNGVMVSLDQTEIFIASLRGLWVFDLNHGLLSNPKQLLKTATDGLGKDCAGNIYATTNRPIKDRDNGQVVIVLDKQHKELGQIIVPGIHIVTNVAFGGEDRQTLFVTGLTAPMNDQGTGPRMCGKKGCLPAGIYTARTNIKGFPN